MKKIILSVLIGMGTIVLLSGCSGRLQSPYVCEKTNNSCRTSETTKVVVVPQKTQKIVKTYKRNSCEPYCCYGYGTDGRCIAW